MLYKTTPEFARKMRIEIIKMLSAAGSGHPGGSLSATDILAVLYNEEMRVDPAYPDDPDRDRFVLSKGHAAPALYAALALSGFFPLEQLRDLRKLGRPLQGHPDMHKVPGVDMSTGSLGQGLAAACGMALASRLDARDNRVFVLCGDGEMQEGEIWESAMFAAHYKLHNLVAFVDHNHLQIDGHTCDVMNPEPLADKWRAFGWHVMEINGHDLAEIRASLVKARSIKQQPVMIIAETIKGKGVSFMEDQAGWHGKAPNAEETAQALAELEG